MGPALLLALLQCTTCTLACSDPGTSPVHSPSDFPPAMPNASIEVYFLRAPLLESHVKGSYLGLLNMWHSAVGFRADNGTFWQFEYDARDFVGALYPQVQPNGTLTWNNLAEVCFRPDVGQRQTYWQFSAQVAHQWSAVQPARAPRGLVHHQPQPLPALQCVSRLT